MRSPALTPLVISIRFSRTAPVVTRLQRHVLVGADDRDVAFRRRAPMAGSQIVAGSCSSASVRVALQERDAGAHLRQQAVAGIDDLNFHLHVALARSAVGMICRSTPFHFCPGNASTLTSAGLPFVQLADACFVDVGLDFERVQIDERADRAGRQRAGDLPHHHRGDHFADFGVLRRDRAVERRADDHVLHVDADLRDARARRFQLRVGGVERARGGDAVLPERGLAFPFALRLARARRSLRRAAPACSCFRARPARRRGCTFVADGRS